MMEISEQEKRHKELAGIIASQGMVLLENDGTLPLVNTSQNIALYGTGARHTIKGGIGSGEVNVRDYVTVEQGLENAGFCVTTKAWLDAYDEMEKKAYQTFLEQARERIRTGEDPMHAIFGNPYHKPNPQLATEEDVDISDTDTAVCVISRISGEGADRYDVPGDYRLSMEEKSLIAFLAENYTKFILLLNVGGVIDTSEIRKISGVNAVLLMSQAGIDSGNAAADILTGKVTPSGKLAATWAQQYADYPYAEEFSHNNGDLDDSYYREGIYVGYRHFDTFGKEVAYCFGYGLSYTKFSIKPCNFQLGKETAKVDVTVTNIGCKYAGQEVVQLYISAPKGNIDKPYQELRAYAKTKVLKPGESQKISLSFAVQELASYNEVSSSWMIEAGEYLVRIGNSSRNTYIAYKFIIDDTIVTKTVIPLFSQSGNHIPDQKNIKAFVNQDEKLFTMEDVLAGTCTLEEVIAQMTVEELAAMCVGSAWEGNEQDLSIGIQSLTVPGAAGETTLRFLKDRHIGNLIMADGPAGLRLEPIYDIDRQGRRIGRGGALPVVEDVFMGMDDIRVPERDACKEKNEIVSTHYQYCTAIPIATLLAQTWDRNLLQEVGNLVAEEMLQYGINLWLAPGMNIQRNPLCGRNYEYFSEDPLVSGICAASITIGVQKHAGTGTTIKHFVGNNQEDNRSYNNSHISERALREIYLKGFEICIREAEPMAVMSSYNLLNGVHTANHYPLLTSYLRGECGFDGIVMSDWGTTQLSKEEELNRKAYPHSSSSACIAAGNDLIMPGTRADMDEIIKAVHSGELSLAALRQCALRLLTLIVKIGKKE